MRKFVACMVAVVAAGTSMASPGPTPLAASSTIPPPNDMPYPGTLKLSVDTTDITRRVFKVHEDIPIAAAGDVVLFYPRWLPGTHAPEGPIDRLAGLTVSARGARIAWTRDALDPFAFHVPVPAGVTAIGVDFAYLSPVGKQIGRQEVGREMLVLDWDAVVLYPAGYFTRQPVDDLVDWDKTMGNRDVIAHEYVHSWDGKFRRPVDLWTPDYNTAMRNSLLWVYEGGTSYWGEVLTARAGLWTKQQALDELAGNIASMQAQAGRSWRSLQDTTNDEIINPRRPMSWPSWQRFEDYYPEGGLIWLDADTLIREKSGGKQSLDDFARTFFGVNDGSTCP